MTMCKLKNTLATVVLPQIDDYLRDKGSPLAGQGEAFVNSGRTHNVDPRLLVAIAGAETTFGLNTCAEYNAWNWFYVDTSQCSKNRLSAIRVLTPDGKEDTMAYVFDTTGNQLHFQYAGTILLVPGSYQLGVNDTLSQPITLNAGETVEFRLGVIQVGGSFELYDAAGNRLGLSRKDTALVVPGTYTVQVRDGPTFENVVVKAGEVTAVK